MSDDRLEIGFQASSGLVHVSLGGAILTTDPASAREIAKNLIETADKATDMMIEEMK